MLQIHLYTRGCHSQQSLGHLSVAETEMLRDPEGSQQVRVGRVLEWVLPWWGVVCWGTPGVVLDFDFYVSGYLWVTGVSLRVVPVLLIAHLSRKAD